MSAPVLPAALAPWAVELSFLTDELALALGPLVRRLAAHVGGTNWRHREQGEPDGVDGLTRAGSPERLVFSEWLLAEAEPLEFLRRAAEGELLHLAEARRDTMTSSRLHVLADCGPEQLGAARLVQLAALMVLARRAAADRVELVVGLLGDEPGQWRGGDLDQLLRHWLKARRLERADPAEVAAWARTVGDGETWLLTGPGQPSAPGLRVLATREVAWDGQGARMVEATLTGRSVRLTLPPAPTAIRALRGEGFRTRPKAGRHDAPDTASGAVFPAHHPAFPMSAPVLLARGASPETIIEVRLPKVEVRVHRFTGPVLTAWRLSHRVIALVCLDGGRLRVESRGRRLTGLDQLTVTVPELGFGDDAHLRPLEPIVLHGNLRFRWEDRWWQIHPDGPHAVVPCEKHRNPLDSEERLARANAKPGRAFPDAEGFEGLRVLFGTPNTFAVASASADGTSWLVFDDLQRGGFISTTDSVIGLTRFRRRPALVELSADGQIIRLSTDAETKTLTRWSGTGSVPAVHPTRPWLAVTRLDGTIEVGDTETDQRMAVIGEDSVGEGS